MDLTTEKGTQPVVHGSFVIDRTYAASPERVFEALADPKKKVRWFRESAGPAASFTMDFRVGGVEHSSFRISSGPYAGTEMTNDTTYLDIVSNRRVIIAYNMSLADRRISASLATFEISPKGSGARLVFTEQAAFLEGADGPEMRKGGWTELLDKLGEELAS